MRVSGMRLSGLRLSGMHETKTCGIATTNETTGLPNYCQDKGSESMLTRSARGMRVSGPRLSGNETGDQHGTNETDLMMSTRIFAKDTLLREHKEGCQPGESRECRVECRQMNEDKMR